MSFVLFLDRFKLRFRSIHKLWRVHLNLILSNIEENPSGANHLQLNFRNHLPVVGSIHLFNCYIHILSPYYEHVNLYMNSSSFSVALVK